jgi:putative FmdB family regulatory protein
MEKLQRMSDAPLTDCPACEQAGLRRLISAAGFRLKGGGWYETDFKQGQKRNLADGGDSKSDSKSDSNSDSKSDSKSDSAPAGGGDSKPATSTGNSTKADSGAKKPAPAPSDA